jgi:hypothetical protein
MDEEDKVKTFKMGDDLIAVIRELVQLSFLTGTNIVDHLRAVIVQNDEESGKLIPTQEYIEAYEQMISDLNDQAKEAQEAYVKAQMETESTDNTPEEELN